MKQLDWKRLFVGGFENTYYSMLGKCCGRNNSLCQLRPKTPLLFLCKMKKNCKFREFAFWQTSTTFSQKKFQNDFVDVVAAKAMRILSFNDSSAFNQSDMNVSHQLIRYETVT